MKIVQIGTNNGADSVNAFCLQNNPEFVLLVEPFKFHNDNIRKNYDKIISSVHIENIAIHPINNLDSISLFYADRDGPEGNPNHSFEVTSMIPDHLIKHGYSKNELREFTVPALTLHSLFDKYSLKTIDYLFLDIEGIDFEVLQSIDFEKYDIKYLQIEHLHLDKQKLLDFMVQKRYRPLTDAIDTYGYDTLFKKLPML